MSSQTDVLSRLDALEQRLRRTRGMAGLAVLALAGFVAGGAIPDDGPKDEVVTHRLVLLDDEGRPRLVLGQDEKDTQRKTRAVGLTLHDGNGAERAGFSVSDDGAVVLGLDAPLGVGSPMRDRLALIVTADGAAEVRMLGNDTGIPVRLVTDPDGKGGLEFLDYDLEERTVSVERVTFGGSSTNTFPLDG